LGVFLSEGISGQHQNPINLENEKNWVCHHVSLFRVRKLWAMPIAYIYI
jgi:hypothetical protein